MKPRLFVLFVAASLLGLALIVPGCHSPQGAQADEAPAVTVCQPLVESIAEQAIFTGRIVAVEDIELRSRVSGYLKDVFFTDGKEVEAGDKLILIDPEPYKAALAHAKGEVDAAKANVKTSKALFEIQDKLLPKGSTSKEEHDKAAGNWDLAKAKLLQAEASLKDAEINLGYTEIKAEVAGKVGKLGISKGNLVVGDKTLLTTLVSVDPVRVEFDVDERTVLEVQENIRKGKFKSVAEAAVPVWLSLANEKGTFTHKGTIDFVDNRVSGSTGTLKVRAMVPNPLVEGARRFTPGLFVRVKMDLSIPSKQLLVADRAIGTDLDKKFLYVINDKKVVERRPVQTGPLLDGLRVIYPDSVVFTDKGIRLAKAGEKGVPSLKDGEWVAIDNLQQIYAGVTVTTVEAKMPRGDGPVN